MSGAPGRRHESIAIILPRILLQILSRILAPRVTLHCKPVRRYTYARSTAHNGHGLLHGGDSPDGKELVVRNLIRNFLLNEQGATAIEYGLIAAGISVAIIAVVQGLGSALNSTFSTVSSALK